jgi:hypothetical protein
MIDLSTNSPLMEKLIFDQKLSFLQALQGILFVPNVSFIHVAILQSLPGKQLDGVSNFPSGIY